MSTEELLRPRYKVKIKAPGCPFKPGDVIEKHKYASGNWYIPNYMYDPEDYPEVFRKLEWHEDRAVEDMPQYVRVINDSCARDTGVFCKVYKWHIYDDRIPIIRGQFGAEIEGYTPDYLLDAEFNFPGQVYGRLNATHLQPATLAEYEQYINKKEGKRQCSDCGVWFKSEGRCPECNPMG